MCRVLPVPDLPVIPIRNFGSNFVLDSPENNLSDTVAIFEKDLRCRFNRCSETNTQKRVGDREAPAPALVMTTGTDINHPSWPYGDAFGDFGSSQNLLIAEIQGVPRTMSNKVKIIERIGSVEQGANGGLWMLVYGGTLGYF